MYAEPPPPAHRPGMFVTLVVSVACMVLIYAGTGLYLLR